MARAGLTPDVVVGCAGDLADRDGFDALNLAAVAERLGVRVPSLYKHVAGLPDLRRRLALAGMRDLGTTLAAAVGDGRAGRASPAAGLSAAARAYRAYGHAHPGRYAAALRAPDPDDDEALAVAASVTALMVGVVRHYGLDGDRAVHGVRCVRAALHGFVALEQAGGFGMPQDVDESFEQVVILLDAGLRVLGGRGADAHVDLATS